MRISEISVRRPVLAIVISLLLIVLGTVSLMRLWPTIRELPDVNPPVVSIDTTYRGASAEIIESKVTQPIEERIAGLEGVDKLKSTSLQGHSSISVEFNLERNIDEAANDVRDRVARAISSLPDQALPPEISKADSSAEPIMFMSVISDRSSVLDLTDYVERNIVDRFSALPGVARVQLSGDRHYAMRLWIKGDALAARRLTTVDVENALRRGNVQLPAGRLESKQREFVLNATTGLLTEDDFRQLVVGRGPDGFLVRLGEVADVALGAANERTISRTDNVAGITVGLVPQATANALEIADEVHAEVKAIAKDLPPGMTMAVSIDRAVFIRASLHEVLTALAISLTLVLLVLYAFFGDWRATVIPAVAIPVSIIAACSAIYALGFSINTLTLLGIVLAIGLVVDDAIVVLENIYRRIEAGERSLLAAIDGAKEIGFAVIATTAVLSAVFVPISFLSGRVGRLFGEFGLTLAAAILFSCLIALTLTPMMTSQLFAKGRSRGRMSHWVDELFGRCREAYARLLRRTLSRAWLVAAVAALLFAGSLALYSILPQESVPEDDRGLVRAIVTGPEGASLAYMDRYGQQLEQIIQHEKQQYHDILRFNMRIPGGGGLSSSEDVNRVQSSAVLEDWDQRTRTVQDVARSLRAKMRSLTGVRAVVAIPTAFNWGATDPVRAVLMGPDYATLSQWRDRIIAKASANPGLLNIDSDYKQRTPHMDVEIDRNRAADLGVSIDAIGSALETMLASRTVGTFARAGREYDVIVQARSGERASPSDLENIYVRAERTGELVPLASVVHLTESATATQLNRFNRLRAVTITASLAPGYSMGDAVNYMSALVHSELPAAAKLDFDGESREYLKSSRALYWTFLGALIVVFLVLAAQFESFVLPLVIMSTVPLALVGSVVGLWLWGITVNIFSQIAIIMLVGLAAKNGVLIVEFANQLRDRGVEFTQAIVEAASTRLRPVVMTSLCSALGALPLMLASGAGSEGRQPIGVVILFGVSISLALTLLVVPAVYLLMARNTRSPEYWTRVIGKMRGAAGLKDALPTD